MIILNLDEIKMTDILYNPAIFEVNQSASEVILPVITEKHNYPEDTLIAVEVEELKFQLRAEESESDSIFQMIPVEKMGSDIILSTSLSNCNILSMMSNVEIANTDLPLLSEYGHNSISDFDSILSEDCMNLHHELRETVLEMKQIVYNISTDNLGNLLESNFLQLSIENIFSSNTVDCSLEKSEGHVCASNSALDNEKLSEPIQVSGVDFDNQISSEAIQTSVVDLDNQKSSEAIQTSVVDLDNQKSSEAIQTSDVDLDNQKSSEAIQTSDVDLNNQKVSESIQTSDVDLNNTKSSVPIQISDVDLESEKSSEAIHTNDDKVDNKKVSESIQTSDVYLDNQKSSEAIPTNDVNVDIQNVSESIQTSEVHLDNQKSSEAIRISANSRKAVYDGNVSFSNENSPNFIDDISRDHNSSEMTEKVKLQMSIEDLTESVLSESKNASLTFIDERNQSTIAANTEELMKVEAEEIQFQLQLKELSEPDSNPIKIENIESDIILSTSLSNSNSSSVIIANFHEELEIKELANIVSTDSLAAELDPHLLPLSQEIVFSSNMRNSRLLKSESNIYKHSGSNGELDNQRPSGRQFLSISSLHYGPAAPDENGSVSSQISITSPDGRISTNDRPNGLCRISTDDINELQTKNSIGKLNEMVPLQTKIPRLFFRPGIKIEFNQVNWKESLIPTSKFSRNREILKYDPVEIKISPKPKSKKLRRKRVEIPQIIPETTHEKPFNLLLTRDGLFFQGLSYLIISYG
jgi:uncharacterized protein (DUF1786 family)